MSNFNHGIKSYGFPILPGIGSKLYTGNVYFVDNGNPDGSDNTSSGTKEEPFSTWDYAIGRATANNGDIIIVMPGHAETLAAASAVTHDVAGLTVYFVGEGADKPTFTFSATASTVVVSAASTKLIGYPIFKPSIDSVVSPLVVNAADCYAEIDIQDASDTVECVRGVLGDASADRLVLNLKYRGRTGGNACVNAVRLVGSDGARIRLDFYGKASTAIVELHTTACTDVDVSGYVYVSGTTDGTKNIVDTVTGSTWYSDVVDGAAGSRYTGGSASAVASDDISAISSTLGTANATTTDSVHGKIGTDTEMADNSLYDLIGADAKTDAIASVLSGAAGIATFPTAAAAANAVSLAEVIRYISELQVPRVAVKESGAMSGSYDTGTTTIFTVTGDCLVKMAASMDVQVTTTSNNGTLEAGITGNTACLLVQDVADGTAFDIGDSWTLTTAADANGAELADEWVLIGNGVDIIVTIGTNNVTAGEVDFYCHYLPLTAGSSIVAV